MKFLIAALIPLSAVAGDCTLYDRSVSTDTAVIAQRSGMRQHVVPAPTGGQRCLVSFQALIGNEWYAAQGQYDWAGDRPSSEACAVAAERADQAALKQAAPALVRSEKVLICNDRTDTDQIRQAHPGTIGSRHQFRPHPDYPHHFWHNGAECTWFLEPAFVGGDIYRYQGVICQLNQKDWIVVDKF